MAGYSDAANMASEALGKKMGAEEQGMADAQAPDAAKGGNPVVDALRTLALFVQAQGQAGNPQADAMKEALVAFMQSTKGQGSPEGMMPEGMPGDMPEGEAPPEMPAASPGEEMALKAKKMGKPTRSTQIM